MESVHFTQEKIQDLITKARQVRSNSHSPYSKFRVGAVLVTDDDVEFKGCNVENLADGSSTCAEVCAIVKAVSEGYKHFKAVVITGDLEDYLYPCGNCRCVLAEFGDMEVFLTKSTGTEYRFHRLSEIYPGSFKTMSGLLNKQPNGTN